MARRDQPRNGRTGRYEADPDDGSLPETNGETCHLCGGPMRLASRGPGAAPTYTCSGPNNDGHGMSPGDGAADDLADDLAG